MSHISRFSRLTAPLFSAALLAVCAILHSPAAALHAAVVEPVRSVLFVKGTPVPGAGVPGSEIPEGAVWTRFGTPAINDAGETAFFGRWAAGAERGAGIFVTPPDGSTARLRVKVGHVLSGVGRFGAFRDPQIASDGGLLFFATVQGGNIKPETATVLCFSSGQDALPQLVARAGVPVPGQRGLALAAIGGAVLGPGGHVALRGFLAHGPRTTDANDQVAFTWKPETPVLELALREGEQIAGLGSVKAFATMVSRPFAPGADHGWFFVSSDGVPYLHARALFTNAITRVVALTGGFKTSLVSAGAPRPTLTTDFRGVAMPSFSQSGNPRAAYRAVTHAGVAGIFHLDPANEFSEPVMLEGQAAPQIAERTILRVSDPLCAPDSNGSLWFASVGKTVVEPGRVLYWANGGAEPLFVAREGMDAAGCEPGERWKRITSLALPAGPIGPIFIATLAGPGVNETKDRGLWAVDAEGALRLLLREGDLLGGETVRTFHVLRATSGAPGVGRSYNRAGQLVVLVFYTNGTTAIARIDMPPAIP